MLNYGMVAWYNCLSIRLQNEMEKPRRKCQRIVRNSTTCIKDQKSLYSEKLGAMTKKILEDREHPLHKEYQMMPLGRRLRLPKIRTNRYKFSFIPSSVRLFNTNQ